ncbi:MAG: phosphoesterase, partial [Verrucomicrobia bacterium]
MSFTLAALLVLLVAAGCHRQPQVPAGIASIERVGRAGANRIVTPVNQILTPAGIQVELAGLRPQVIALSPDGRLLSTSGKTRELIILDAATGSILQRVSLPSDRAAESSPGAVSPHILEPDK